ncbi:hypothetical protein B296_00003168 [Ensete ventricosum]|uniref:Uncharacterized protein n=1 Tax=Ensete ventricosum TaxID=4639 RepID=A0A427ANB2_ENSVE|nr:hypothetical protein B296_00003168 [Ensete ventricosum]
MKAGHDLDMAVTEGSLAAIRKRYNIPVEYGLHVSQFEQRPYSSDVPGVPDGSRQSSWNAEGVGGKTLAAHSAAPTQEVGEAPPIEAPRSSSKRPSDSSVPSDDPARRHKKVKILSRRHKSRHGEGGSRSHSKGKEPAVSVEEPEGQVKSPDEAGTSIFVRPKSIKDLCGTKVCKDDVGYYALYMSDLAQHDLDKEMRARWEKLRNSPKVWSDHAAAEEFERGLLHPQLARELYTLLSEVLLARAAKEMVLRVAELEKELERTQQERTEALQRLEVSDKDLNEVQGDLSKARKHLKEVRVRARKAGDDLLKSMKDLEGAQVELPMQAINDYKGSAGFKEGLKRMG